MMKLFSLFLCLCLCVQYAVSRDVFQFEAQDDETKNVGDFQYCFGDKKYKCMKSETCCLTGEADPNKYRCCGLTNANCCNNGHKCCPSSYTCTPDSTECRPSLLFALQSFRSQRNRGAIKQQSTRNSPVQDVHCPDSYTKCDPGQTCCKLPNGEFACCPLPNAECCNDGLHCCPHDTVCDSNTGTCNNARTHEFVSVMVRKLSGKKVQSNRNCPASYIQCDPGHTCCKLPNGVYSCCPLPNAKCCNGGLYCCPHDTECDSNAGTCNNTRTHEFVSVMVRKLSGKKVKSVTCGDGSSQCGDGETCCKLADGSYGCCPYPKAVCCNDHVHCCPGGTTCNVASGTCDSSQGAVAYMLKKVASKKVQLKSVICPDGSSQCGDDQTCCKLGDGSYGCCPLPNAACCSDNVHCCPAGTTCNVAAGTCNNQQGFVMKMMKKVASKKVQIKSVTCGDGSSQCGDGETCCKLTDGSYGCCPYPKAVCCNDHVHCCPGGTTCNVASGTCDSSQGAVANMLKKVSSKKVQVKSVICPDGSSQCGDDQTCCKLADGSYGCCPLPNAVCCSDNVHCCPAGTTCNVAAGTCNNQQGFVMNMVKKIPSTSNKAVLRLCPGKSTSCNSTSTCCLMSDKMHFGCCPYENAVCCPDMKHCCPHATICNMKKNTCDSGSVRGKFPVLKNMAAFN